MKFLSTEKFFLFIKQTERKKLCEMKLWELFTWLQLSQGWCVEISVSDITGKATRIENYPGPFSSDC